MKIRHYGFLNPNSPLSIEMIRELIALIQDVIADLLPHIPQYKKPTIKCSCCGQALKFIAFLKPLPRWGPSG